MGNTKVWDKKAVQELIATNDKAVYRALLTVYANQTQAEQANHVTAASNNIGFTAFDAAVLTSFAQFLQKTGFLTPKQLAITRGKIKKYHRQLLDAIALKGFPVYKTKGGNYA